MFQTPTNFSRQAWVGSCHGDDVLYAFGIPFTSASEYSDEDRAFSKAVMAYWTMFVRTG